MMLIALQSMLTLPKEELLDFSDEVVNSLPHILAVNVPRKVVDLVKKVWFKLHSLTPRRYSKKEFLILSCICCKVHLLPGYDNMM